jgi:hypothetical protein
MLEEAAEFATKNVSQAAPNTLRAASNFYQFKFEAKDFSYGTGPWGSPRLRKAMANHMNRHFHPLKQANNSRRAPLREWCYITLRTTGLLDV